MFISHIEHRKLNERFFYEFDRNLLVSLCIAALFFAAAAYAFMDGHKEVGLILIAGFGLTIIGFPGYAFYRIKFVTCPICLGKTKSFVDMPDKKWVARCQKCAIDRELGIYAEEDLGSS